MDNDIGVAIIKTLSYYDIFDYPPTAHQIYKFIHSKREVPKELINKHLDKMGGVIKKRGKYCFFDGRRDIIEKRISRKLESRRKLKYAKSALRLLCFIPSIKFLGISGSLSMNNSREEDDIDIFVITNKNALWITRFFVTIILLIFRKKRRRGDLFVKDKICPNMFLSTDNLTFEKKERSLFLAHEITQLKVIVNKNKTYEQFLCANKWIKNLLLNSISFKLKSKNIKIDVENYSLIKFILGKLINLLDSIFYKLQLLYMKKQITREIVGKNIARFHPDDKESFVMSEYRKRCRFYLDILYGKVLRHSVMKPVSSIGYVEKRNVNDKRLTFNDTGMVTVTA